MISIVWVYDKIKFAPVPEKEKMNVLNKGSLQGFVDESNADKEGYFEGCKKSAVKATFIASGRQHLARCFDS